MRHDDTAAHVGFGGKTSPAPSVATQATTLLSWLVKWGGGRFDPPAQGWESEGVALGNHGLVEWSVLDAQWFGLAQRRIRVFAVLDTGNWAGRPPVLLEPYGLRGDSAPRRAAGEVATGTLESRLGRSGVSADFAASGGLIASLAHGQGNAEITTGDFAPTLTCNHEAPIMVAHTLRAEGFDASEDGTGRGIPLVPVCPIQNATRGKAQNGSGIGSADAVMFTLDQASHHAIAFDCKASGLNGFGVGDVSPTIRAMGRLDSHGNGGGQVAVAVSLRGREGGGTAELGGDVQCALRASKGGGDKPHVLSDMQVRRLTPRECERLQGLDDDWTLVPNRHGKPMADGPRYKMIGNGFARPVIAWIGRQITIAHTTTSEQAA